MEGIDIQTQNFNSGNVGGPSAEKPKSNKGKIIAAVVLFVIIAAAAAYFFLVVNKTAAPITQTGTMAGPTTPPQVAGPTTPPPASDELSDISSDLNVIDLNALDKDTQADANAINSAL